MRTPRSPKYKGGGIARRERPQFTHIILGAGVSAFSNYLLLMSFQYVLMETTAQLLSLGRIAFEKSAELNPPALVLRLVNGSELGIVLTWQRSGLFSILIFCILFVLLVFPLSGPLWLKISWLEVGSVVGLTWSLFRFSTNTLIAYHFGTEAFALAELVAGPAVDFMWIIPVWSLGLSAIVSARKRQSLPKRG